MNVTVYSRETCSPCKSLKTYLKNKAIDFVEKNIDESDEAQAEAYAYAGMSIVPVTVVTKEDGSREVVSGLNLQRLVPILQS